MARRVFPYAAVALSTHYFVFVVFAPYDAAEAAVVKTDCSRGAVGVPTRRLSARAHGLRVRWIRAGFQSSTFPY